MAYIRADMPAIKVDHPGVYPPKRKNRAVVSMTSQLLESTIFKGNKILHVSYDHTREIISFHLDMGDDETYFTPEGQEAVEIDWFGHND